MSRKLEGELAVLVSEASPPKRYDASGGPSALFEFAEGAARIEVHRGDFSFGWSTDQDSERAMCASLDLLNAQDFGRWAVGISTDGPPINGEVKKLKRGNSGPLLAFLGRNAAELRTVRVSRGPVDVVWRAQSPDAPNHSELFICASRYDPAQLTQLFARTALPALAGGLGTTAVFETASELLRSFKS